MSTDPAQNRWLPSGQNESANGPPWPVLLTVTTAFAWLGFFIHNVADLPDQSILNPGTLYPTLLTLTLLVLWFPPKTRTFGAQALLVWASLNVVGGALSVLPLPFLPFVPEQSIEHYAFHVLYAISQVPLIVTCTAWLRHDRRRRSPKQTPTSPSPPGPQSSS